MNGIEETQLILVGYDNDNMVNVVCPNYISYYTHSY